MGDLLELRKSQLSYMFISGGMDSLSCSKYKLTTNGFYQFRQDILLGQANISPRILSERVSIQKDIQIPVPFQTKATNIVQQKHVVTDHSC